MTMEQHRSIFTFLFFYFYYQFNLTFGFNVDVVNSKTLTGPESGYFGYAVAILKNRG